MTRPIKEELRPPFEDRDLMRVWHRVSRARSTPAAPKLPWAIAAAAVIALLVAVWPREVPVDRIEGAAVTPLFETADQVSYLLSSGRIEVSIEPGRRRTIFECGLATVEVVGTRFAIDRRESSVRIDVYEGRVLVRSPHLVDVRLLSAGDQLTVEAPRAALEVDSPPPRIAASKPVEPSNPIEPAEPMVERASRPRIERPIAQLPPSPPLDTPDAGPPLPTAEELLALADDARRTARHAEAAELFRRLIADHPNDPRAALASFSLGKIELDVNAHPKEAAAAFERALAIGLPAVLVEDAYARLVDSQLAAGDRASASNTAKKYLIRFPYGRHRARLGKIAG